MKKTYYYLIGIIIFLLLLKQQQKKRVLIALPTIDRDFCFADKFYKSLQNSIPKFSNYKFDIVTIMREQDTNMNNFWKDKSIVKKVKNYDITENRHNLEKVSEIFNSIKNYASDQNYDKLIIIESDIMVKYDTISKLLENLSRSDVVVFPFETPWTGFPLVINKQNLAVNSRELSGDQYIFGHGTGCVSMNKEIIEDEKINFNIETYKNTIGQDVGFFKSLHDNNYKVFMVNDELYHAYKYIERENKKSDIFNIRMV